MNKLKVFSIFAVLLLLVSLSAFATAKPSLEKAIENFDNAREKFLNAKEKFDDAKDNWLQIRQKWQSQKRSQDRNEFLSKAQNYMLRSTEHLINYLEMTRARAEKIENLEEADLNSITAQIDAEIAKLEALKAKIQSTDSNQLSSIAAEVKAEWDNVKAFSKKIVGLILAANTNKVIAVAEKIGQKAEERINALDANGFDSNAASQALAEFNAFIQAAKDKRALAVEKFLQITDSNNAQSLFKEGHDLLKEAHKELTNAHKSLKDIIREIVGLKKDSRPEKPEDENESQDQNQNHDENEED